MDSRPLAALVADAQPHAPVARIIGRINWIGFWTLFSKEVRRFVKVYMQTVAAPVVTTLLTYAVFSLALGAGRPSVGGVPYFNFLAPGLIMMSMAQNAFANTSSSVMIAKIQGNIIDVLMTPISPLELAVAYTLGGVVRGLAVGLVTALAIEIFLPMHVIHIGAVLLFGILATMLLSLIGIIGGIWAVKFDHIAAVTNFIVTPMTMLSGTFYSIDKLPPAFLTVMRLNPFFYMIDGFRYGFIGQAEASLTQGALVLLGANAVLWLITIRMLVTGYKLKS